MNRIIIIFVCVADEIKSNELKWIHRRKIGVEFQMTEKVRDLKRVHNRICISEWVFRGFCHIFQWNLSRTTHPPKWQFEIYIFDLTFIWSFTCERLRCCSQLFLSVRKLLRFNRLASTVLHMAKTWWWISLIKFFIYLMPRSSPWLYWQMILHTKQKATQTNKRTHMCEMSILRTASTRNTRRIRSQIFNEKWSVKKER